MGPSYVYIFGENGLEVTKGWWQSAESFGFRVRLMSSCILKSMVSEVMKKGIALDECREVLSGWMGRTYTGGYCSSHECMYAGQKTL